jgi:hypothetical protein
VWESLEAVQRAVERLHEDVTIDIAGDHQAQARVERQDLDEMLGNPSRMPPNMAAAAYS